MCCSHFRALMLDPLMLFNLAKVEVGIGGDEMATQKGRDPT